MSTVFYFAMREKLITELLVLIIGPVLEELLSGMLDETMFSDLKAKLGQFDDLPITTTHDYETAAGYYNICRKHGVQGSRIDLLVCAVADNDLLIYTTD